MATKLEKDITRESNVSIDGKEINITLTSTQEIKLKLKGTRKGEVKISIEKLYNQLTGNEVNDNQNKGNDKPSKKITKSNPMISLYDLRSHNAISTMDIATKAKFDQIIKSLIDNLKYAQYER